MKHHQNTSRTLNRTASSVTMLVLAFSMNASLASADSPSPPSSSSSTKIPLPPIPPPTNDKIGQPDKQTSAELDRLLTQLFSVKPQEQRKAAGALAEQDDSILPAIAAKLATLRKSADRDGMKRLLEQARAAARKDEKYKKKQRRPKRKVPFGDANKPRERLPLIDPNQTDWLRYVLQDPSPDKRAYRDLVSVLALSRTCATLGTIAAARELINVYMYFGDMFRIDVQRQLERMGERALPVLIEAQYHDSRMVRTWAKRQLDLQGKAIPSEAVRLSDQEALAGVLRAYGKAREVEAVRVIVSFCNSDRRQVRLAAREAIGQIGEPARWQLRDAYKRLMGTPPPRRWSWRRVARELFSIYDRARLRPVYEAMEKGLKLAEQDNVEEAAKNFDTVLARMPMFTRRSEMVPTYLKLGAKLKDEDEEASKQAYRRALVLDPDGPHANEAKSMLALLEAKQLAKRGVIDVTLLERAVQLNPDNDEARRLLDEFNSTEQGTNSPWRRYAAAIAIAVLAFAAMLGLAIYPRKPTEDKDKKLDDRSKRRTIQDAPPPKS